MSKAVLIPIQPKWCELITRGKKTMEVRKNRPKLDTPFKCYIYCTKSNDTLWVLNAISRREYGVSTVCANLKDTEGACPGNGKVIGEFVCDKIVPIKVFPNGTIQNYMFYDLDQTMLPYDDIAKYIGDGRDGCGWHISNLVIYDKPKELSEFSGLRKTKFGLEPVSLTRPPQSWCYVEELKGGEG